MAAYEGPRHRSRGLTQTALQRRLDALFRAISGDFLLREQFVTDPAQVTAEYVLGRRIPEQDAAILNHLIHSALTSQRLIVWFRQYAFARRAPNSITADSFADAFAEAAIAMGAQPVVKSLARLATSTSRVRLDDRWLRVIFGPWKLPVGDGTDDGTGTNATGTDETGTDGTGTDGTGTDGTGTDGTGTDGTGTDGTGTDGTGTDGTGTDGTGTDGTGTDGTGTDGTGTDGTGTDGTGTDGTGTDGTGTDGTGTDATGTDIITVTATTGTVTAGTGGTLTAITWKTFITGSTATTGITASTTPFTHTGMTRSPFTTFVTQGPTQEDFFFTKSHVIAALEALTAYSAELDRAGELKTLALHDGAGDGA